jgi:hypothetical protein
MNSLLTNSAARWRSLSHQAVELGVHRLQRRMLVGDLLEQLLAAFAGDQLGQVADAATYRRAAVDLLAVALVLGGRRWSAACRASGAARVDASRIRSLASTTFG